MADLRTNIATLLLADFKAEAEGGFPTVRRIPSTDAVKFLDYFAALNSTEAAVTRYPCPQDVRHVRTTLRDPRPGFLETLRVELSNGGKRPRSIDLLSERIVYFANLRERIDALPE